ncbi:MAG: FMN-binding protein [Paludibacteraceae bacterium]|nr:FMN-binding protein [Paludibacteraceae bacterium]
MKKLDTNSNVYTIVYATVMVVIVALLLAVVSSALKPKQQANVELDRKKQVLSSLNIDLKGQDAEALYAQLISEQQIDGKQVFVATLEDGSKKYIIPMHGAGLWGAIWGYIALDDDKNTIYGTYFNHDSETPGLGGEITTRYFQTRFNGKHILGAEGYQMEIVKGEAQGEQVQAISGATITSKGVETMINTTLSDYLSFLSGNGSCEAGQSSAESNIIAIETKEQVEPQVVEEVNDPYQEVEPAEVAASINE